MSATPAEPMTTDEIRQHIAWLYQYTLAMNERNWRDMRDNAVHQLDRLSLALHLAGDE